MGRSKGNGDHKRITRATITEQLEDALRTDIKIGLLRPGERIRAGEVAERYGVSATPLREALQRLAGESLIDLDPRLGARVALMSERDVRDIYEMLELMDGIALERSIQRGDDAWLADLDRSWEAMATAIEAREAVGDHPTDDDRRRVSLLWSTAHWDFHETLYARCDSPWLLRFVRQLHAHADRYQMLSVYDAKGRRRDSRAEHREIFEAARTRDVERALASLTSHLHLTVRLLSESMDGEQVPAEGDR